MVTDGGASTPLADAPVALIERIVKRLPAARPMAGPRAPEPSPWRADTAPRDEAIRRYALTALDNHTKKVEQAARGKRNQTLNDSSLALGHLVGAGALAESRVRAAMEAAAVRGGLVEDDGLHAARATISSGLTAGMAQAADLSKIGQRARPHRGAAPTARPSVIGPQASAPVGGDNAADGDAALELNRRLAFFKLTDLANVDRFIARYGGAFKWCPAFGWLTWTGKVWSSVGAEGLAMIATHRTVRAIEAEAAAIEGTADDVEVITPRDTTTRAALVRKWGDQSEGARHFGCLLKNAAGYLEVQASALNTDPMKLNVSNGTLVVRKTDDGSPYITLQPHDPADLITKITPVDYDPEAICPGYDAFLERVQPDRTMRCFLHQWGGLSLTGDTSEEAVAIFHGGGQNGKSTWLETIAHVAGQYADASAIETFIEHKHKRRGDQASPNIASLAGVRFLRTSEPERGSRLAESLLKWLTGGDTIVARHLQRAEFAFKPQFKLVISGNHRPAVRGVDKGIWRRLRLVPWNVTIPEAERDKKLKVSLLAEGSGILNRLLDGLRDWLDCGLVQPDQVTAATAKYREDSDTLGRFLADCTRTDSTASVQSSKLFAVFQAWAKLNGVGEWTQPGFSSAMDDHGFEKDKSGGVMLWRGLKLIREVWDFTSEEPTP